MSLKRFFLYSSVFHAFVIAALIFLVHPAKVKNAGGEFYTSLVSPEELLPPRPVTPPPPRIRSMPGRRSVPSRPSARIRPVPSRPSAPAMPGVTAPLHLSQGAERMSCPKEEPLLPSLRQLLQARNQGQDLKTQERNKDKARAAPSLRERLFDKNIIANLAKRDFAREEEKEKKDKNFTFDAKEYRFLLYNTRLKERIESIWVYPPYEAEHGIYGDLEIRFTIKKNGQLGSVELLRTSGHKSLDDAAIKALREGAPYWPLPDEWGMEAYTIEGHFIYTIYGYFIR